MENQIQFEGYLYSKTFWEEEEINDIGFIVNHILQLPALRPFSLEKAIDLCIRYCEMSTFRHLLLKGANKCPVLIHRLFVKDIFQFNEIEPLLFPKTSYMLCYYFRDFISDLGNILREKIKPDDLDESFLENEESISALIEYGFLPGSIEFNLKYDDIDSFRIQFPISQSETKWSPFEWSIKPDFSDLLSFSAFFASVRCFKFMIMNGFEVNDNVRYMIVCSGSFDLFHISCEKLVDFSCLLNNASKFNHLNMISYFFENGAGISGNWDNFILSRI